MRCLINTIVPLKECMARDAFTDMYPCIHFAEDFDKDKEWLDVFFARSTPLLRWLNIDES
jgi:hypothetical protein